MMVKDDSKKGRFGAGINFKSIGKYVMQPKGFDFDNKMPFMILKDLIKEFEFMLATDETRMKLSNAIQYFQAVLGDYYNLDEDQKHTLRIVSSIGENTGVVRSANLFTGCLMYGYAVNLYEVQGKLSCVLPDGNTVKYNHEHKDFILYEDKDFILYEDTKILNTSLIEELRQYGTIVRCRQEGEEFHVLIEKIDMNARKTFECFSKVVDAVGKQFPIVHKFITGEDVFDLILKVKER